MIHILPIVAGTIFAASLYRFFNSTKTTKGEADENSGNRGRSPISDHPSKPNSSSDPIHGSRGVDDASNERSEGSNPNKQNGLDDSSDRTSDNRSSQQDSTNQSRSIKPSIEEETEAHETNNSSGGNHNANNVCDESGSGEIGNGT